MNHIKLLVLALSFLILLSCAPAKTSVNQPGKPAQEPAAVASPAVSFSQKSAWEGEWQKVIAGTRKESGVLLYGGPGMATVRTPIIQEMKDKFQLNAEMIIAPSGALVAKILAERKAGLYLGDAFVMGAEDLVALLFPSGAALSLDETFILPEVKDPKLWLNEKIPFLDSGHRAVAYQAEVSSRMAYNTSMLKPEEARTFNDLLNPGLKDRMVMLDPTISGSGASWFYLGYRTKGLDYFKEFVKNQPALTRDNRQLVDWVARGKYALAIGVSTPLVQSFREGGAPINMLPALQDAREIRGGVSYSGVLSKTAHPNAAKVFINWLLSREGQIKLSKTTGVASRRLDIPSDHLPEHAVIDPKVNYVSRETEEDFLEKKKAQQLATEAFAPLLAR